MTVDPKKMIGMRFGMLTVIGRSHKDKNSRWHWQCRCVCGAFVTAPKCALDHGQSSCKKCGLKKGAVKRSSHGLSKSPEYQAWCSLKQRCYNTMNNRYSDYGGRGITVCNKWLESFEAFYADMGARPGRAYSIERINNDEGYKPSNCKWATRSDQQRNKRAPNTENLKRGSEHWTRKNPEKAKIIARRNISFAHGSGEMNPNAKITHKIADEIRDYYDTNPDLKMEDLGAYFGVGRETARKIIRGIAWQ